MWYGRGVRLSKIFPMRFYPLSQPADSPFEHDPLASKDLLMGASFSMSFRIWRDKNRYFFVAKKSFEEYLFGVHFRTVILSLEHIGGVISGLRKTGVVFSDTLYRCLVSCYFFCPPFMGSLLRVSFRLVLPAEVLFFGNGGFLADCFVWMQSLHPAFPTSPSSIYGRYSIPVLSVHCFEQFLGHGQSWYVCSSFRHR